MKIQFNKHLEKLLGNKVCPIHGEKIKFNKEIQATLLSFCCEEFRELIETQKDIFEKAALEAANEEIQETFKKWLK